MGCCKRRIGKSFKGKVILSTFGKIVKVLFKYEGGHSNDKLDKGGYTAFGISKNAHPEVDIETLTKEQALEIYRTKYWNPCKAERLKPELRLPYFLLVVNAGQGNAVKVLQKACNAKSKKKLIVDGKIGPKTINASKDLEPLRLESYIVLYYAKIIHKDPTQERFWYGWYKRAINK